ncbi:cytochrome c biogenesis protein ResB [Galenea microaerophila]
MSEIAQNSAKNPSPAPKSRLWVEFLGSMNLAVTLLVMLAIASVIGTILKQDQSVQDYIIKFGPFWSEVFQSLGLFHVYGAAWFILVLLFLLVSTAVCVTRNTPGFLREIKQYNENLSLNALKHQPLTSEFDLPVPQQQAAQTVGETLHAYGYRFKQKNHADSTLVFAGLKGRLNRLGYILTHISIIIICIGALFDSNLLLKYREMTGQLAPETRAVPLNEIPKKSWVGEDNFSFRGSVNIPEGQSSDILFLPYDQGFLVQQLPFKIEVKDFRIRYYDTGMPKSFESDIVLTAPDLEKPIEKTISVNHPLIYKNYAIYQSSFGDGGTKLKIKVYPLLSPTVNPTKIDTAINQIEPLKTPAGTFKAEFNDFKLFNIVPASKEEQAKTGKKMHNNGPSIIFKVRNEQGIAWEYENFMLPVEQQGRWFFITGVRTTPSEPFRYLFIPADKQKSKKRFFEFLALLNDPIKIEKMLQQAFPKTDQVSEKNYRLQIKLMQQLVTLFRQKGFEGITDFVQKNVPKDQQKKVTDFYFGQTSMALQTLYLQFLKQTGRIKPNQTDLDDFDKKWFEDALTTINNISHYGPPMYFELEGFKQIQATGLQITKSPGKNIVFFGSALLTVGVFLLFYVRIRRIWVALTPINETQTHLLMAARDAKKLPETEKEFAILAEEIKEKLQEAKL